MHIKECLHRQKEYTFGSQLPKATARDGDDA